MRITLVAIAILALLLMGISAVLAAGNNIERVSVASDGTQGNAFSSGPHLSGNGRYVAFCSSANNLVPGDTNGHCDVFVRDCDTNITTLASISNNGTQGNGDSYSRQMSDDGRYVTFQSLASNFVLNDTNYCADIFIRDRQTNTTTLVSVSDNGTLANATSYDCSLSGDGRYVAFSSDASNLVPNDTNGALDIFVRDCQTNTTTIVSVANNGTQGNSNSFHANITPDGRYVTFTSYASNLVPNDTNGESDVFVHDRQTNTTTRVSTAYDGTQSNNDSTASNMSSDGRYVTFSSTASNLIPNFSNYTLNVYIKDRQLNTTIIVSISDNGTQGNGANWEPVISGDGRYIAFRSLASNLVPNDTNSQSDIFIKDRLTNSITIVSVSDNSTQGNGNSAIPSINSDGQYVAFWSDANNLVPNDTNGVADVFAAANPLYEPSSPPETQTYSTYTNEEYCFSLQYPSDWVAAPEFVTTSLHMAAFRVPSFVPGVIIAALDADAPMSEDWILQSFEDMGMKDPQLLSWLTETTLPDGTKTTTYKIGYIYPSGYEAVAFCLDADRCDKRIRVMVFTIDAFSPYDETLFSEIAHTLTFTCPCGESPGGSVERISVSDNGTQGNDLSLLPKISADGRYVAFESLASNLVPNDINGYEDIFVRDRQTNTTTLLSVSDNSTQGNGGSAFPSISGDGRFVAFYSQASNLVPNDTNGQSDIFVRDRQTGTTTLVSVSNNGTQGNLSSFDPSISNDGRYIAFASAATDLVPNDTNGYWDIFVRDLLTGTTVRVSVSDNGTQTNHGSWGPSISSTGRYVAFCSYANSLVPNDTNNEADIFVRDLQTNTTTRVSIATDGSQGNNTSERPSINNDGRYVVFVSDASSLVPNDTNGFYDIFVRDRQTNTTSRVNVAFDLTQANYMSYWSSISGDGRYVAFESNATNLVPNRIYDIYDIYVRDRQANTISRVSIATDNGTQGNNESYTPSISTDGRYIAFESLASNLVPNDTNGVKDVFVAVNSLYQHLTTNASVAAATGTGTISISTSSGSIQTLTAVSLNELPYNGRPDNVSFPYGLLSFTITNIPPGSTVTITITYPAPIPQGVQYWKCQNGTWINCTSLIGDDDGDEVLTLTITDGGLGDSDGQVNGQITDPGGPVISVPAPASAPHVSPALPRDLNQTQISLQYLSVNPQQAQVNQPLTIMGNVVNTGNQAGNYNLILKINGRVEQTRMVSVGPQGTQPVKFTITKAQPGTYAVDLGGQTGSFIIIGTGHNGSSSSKGGLLAILIICVMILATIALLIRRPT
jgi:Tol biopolymer transport system component